jgi:CBS domain-containing protein
MVCVQIHRIPVVNNEAKLVGIVTRTDIFTALENEQGNVDVKVSL